jgi:putative transcriptional regulator
VANCYIKYSIITAFVNQLADKLFNSSQDLEPNKTLMERSTFTKKLGRRIAKIRTDKKISQSELAKRCLKDRQSLHRVEMGQRTPSSFYLYELSVALEVPVGAFYEF